jgi:HEPN domain-containing protein
MKPAAQRWIDFAQTDLEMAGIALEHRFPKQCIFHCQQAVEKVLKAIWVDRADIGMPPRTHELPRLARNLSLSLPETDFRFLQTLSE